jgi:hypothetical protein
MGPGNLAPTDDRRTAAAPDRDVAAARAALRRRSSR